MKLAVIKSGKQYLVKEGDKIKIEKINQDKKKLVFDDILFGKKVEAKVLRHGRARKVVIFKYKPKKRYHKKQGHRQHFTEIEITKIFVK
ncbi:MAG: 50S ribosomal protein L21 [bacterium]